MDASRSKLRILTAVAAGVAVGWVSAGFRATPMQASSSDRAGECVVATGSVLQQYDDNTKAAIPLDALYFLDYKGGRLMATVPSFRSDGAKTQLLDHFAERDLVADFKLDLDGGSRPRFLMATGSLGRYSAGWAPLYVFETTTGQVAVYRMQVGQSTVSNASSQFELVELRRYARPAGTAPRPRGPAGVDAAN
jgi:hypothetical protein